MEEHTVSVQSAYPVIKGKAWLQCTCGWFDLIPSDDDHAIAAVKKHFELSGLADEVWAK